MEITNGIIEINKLHDFDYADKKVRFAYNDEAEKLTGSVVSNILGSEFHSQTKGYNNCWDYFLDSIPIEQKISSGMGLEGRPDSRADFGIIIECWKKTRKTPDSEPEYHISGLHTTKADVFLTIMPGFSNDDSTLVGKIRLCTTTVLRQEFSNIQQRLLDSRDEIIQEHEEGYEQAKRILDEILSSDLKNVDPKDVAHQIARIQKAREYLQSNFGISPTPKGTYFIDGTHGRHAYFYPKRIQNIWVCDVDAITEKVYENGKLMGKRIVAYDMNKITHSTTNPKEDWNKLLEKMEKYGSL